jgi:two-component system sensor histidine kinase BaeS
MPKTASPAQEWFVVLRPDGIVETVSGGAPLTWVGHELTTAPGVPGELRDAAGRLVSAVPDSSYLRRQVVSLALGVGLKVRVDLLVVEALPLRRAFTRVGDLLMRTLDAFVTQASSSDIDLRIEQGQNVPVALFMDGEKIAWAVATLVGNALRFVQLRKDNRGHVRVKVEWNDKREELVIAVKDNGPGMPPQRVKWLFDRDPATGASSGVALLMVRDVVTAHRGVIEVQSTPGQGSTFTLRLPRTSPA